MAQPKTNFAMLLGLLGARPRDLVEETGADKSLVSRWTNGKQKLMPGHGWIDKVAGYILSLDARLKEPVVPDVLAAYYPGEALDGETKLRAALLDWLATVGHQPARHQPERAGLAGLIMEKAAQLSAPEPEPTLTQAPPPMKNAVVYGIKGVQGSALQFLEMVTELKEPQEMIFACPEGLEMLTRDKHFIPHFFEVLMRMFAAGHTFSVVVRTDYRVSDIAAFSGPWLVAHLLGYIRSYYYDDFVNSSKDKMLAAVSGKFSGRVSETGEGEIYTTIQFDAETVEKTYAEIKRYQAKSKQRFHYHLFGQPDAFLRGCRPLPDRAHYQFARLPYFCVADKSVVQSSLQLTDDEMSLLEKDFAPLLTSPGYFEPDTPLRHIFCEDDIEDALLKNRHVIQELSAITGRRVLMSTQSLADRLMLLKALLTEYNNYEVAFLSKDVFQRIKMQIVTWGDIAAIGWIAGGKSTACKDYTNVNSLTGFCESVWDRIPNMVKNRRTAIRKLNTWLKKAGKYGYDVTG